LIAEQLVVWRILAKLSAAKQASWRKKQVAGRSQTACGACSDPPQRLMTELAEPM
jgi:hypothetical protein